MKKLLLSLTFCVTVSIAAFAQNVADTHPTAAIFAIDYSTGQEVQVNYDAAILFKNAFIDLVSNSTIARMQVTRMIPGKKTFVITQMDPQTNGNAYQLVLQNVWLNRTTPVYNFLYSVDQNTLSFLDPQSGRYVPVPVQGYNVNNLNNCANYGTFNVPPPPPSATAPPQAPGALAADAAPVDQDVSANTAPPALPDYDQPECPVDGYLWQPGYWAYSPDNAAGYYWVPGAWVAPPDAGLLWTPPYWGFDNGLYVFHSGYWGPTIGFYGGINYGFGYGGVGFVGGNWYNGHFRYNTAVVRVNVGVVHNVYVDRSVVVVRDANSRMSFNGRGGVMARPNDRELAAMREHHVMATTEQIRNQRAAREDRSQFASANGGRPGNVAAARAMEPRPNTNAGGRPGMNGAQPNGGRPGMNGGAPNNGQMNNSGRPNVGGQANNNAVQPNNAGGAQGARPGAAPAANGAPGANAAQGNRPPTAAGAPGARPGQPATGQTGVKPGTQPKQAPKTKTPPPPVKKP